MSGVLSASGPVGHTAQMIQKAPDFTTLRFELEWLHMRIGQQRLKSVANQERLTADDYQAFISAANSHYENRATVKDDGLVYKAKQAVGRQLLDERHTKAREELDAALEGFDLPALRERANAMSASEVGRLKKALTERVGITQLTRDFSEHMVATGQWSAVSELQSATGARLKQINIDFNRYLRNRAAPGAGAVKPDVEEVGRRVIEHALAVTGLSRREAAQMAARKTSTHKGGRAAASKSPLKSGGLDAAIVKAMQLAGRVLPGDTRVSFASNKEINERLYGRERTRSGGRSYHMEIASGELDRARESMICVTGNMDESTVFHEIGHAIDAANPLANAMVVEWVRQRTDGKPVEKLRSLTGIKAFSTKERTIKDDFIDPYVGKQYTPRRGIASNEALSMGFERLSRPDAAGMLALKDPDHLALVLAVLQLEYPQ